MASDETVRRYIYQRTVGESHNTKKEMTMHRARLKKLANFLVHDVKDSWFYLGSWASAGFSEKQCGSTACALGWTPSCFPRGSMKLMNNGGSPDVCFTNRKGRKFWGFAAANEFFDIDDEQAYQLFDPGAYDEDCDGREDVAQRIIEMTRLP